MEDTKCILEEDKGLSSLLEDEENDLFNLVFANDLIGNNIATYCNLWDLKMASGACRVMHNMVRNSQAFSKMAMLRLVDGNALTRKEEKDSWEDDQKSEDDMDNKDGFQFKPNPTHGWGIIEFDISIAKEILEFLQKETRLLDKVHTVRLSMGYRNKLRENLEAEIRPLMQHIFNNGTTKIVTLQIVNGLFKDFDFRNIIPTEVQSYFIHLRNLEIFQVGGKQEIKDKDRLFNMICHSFENRDKVFIGNLQIFSVSLGLCQIHIDNLNILETAVVGDLIFANSETLQDLNINGVFSKFWSLERMQQIILPSFRKLTTSLSDDKVQTDNFLAFLANQPYLEELCIHVKEKCDLAILELIKGRGIKLKKFHLRAKIIDKDVDWTFLSNMKELKNFGITRPARRAGAEGAKLEGTGVSFLKSLPPSLTRLKLRGIQNFWWDEIEGGFVLDDMGKQTLMSRFPELVHLNIIRCEGAVDDKVVQSIIRMMPKLQTLELSHSGTCTDYAITGITNEEKTGSCLMDLKGLSHLRINTYVGSDDAIISSVSHPFLRTLILKHCWQELQITIDQVILLAQQNPSLESLSINVSRFKSEEMAKKMKSVINNNRLVQLDLKSEIDNGGRVDSDSDASDQDNDSDSYEEYDHHDYDNHYSYDDDDDDYDDHGYKDFAACDKECGYCGHCDY